MRIEPTTTDQAFKTNLKTYLIGNYSGYLKKLVWVRLSVDNINTKRTYNLKKYAA